MMFQLAAELRRFAATFDKTYKAFLSRHISHRPLRRRVFYAVSLIGVRERAFLTRTSAQLCGVRWSDVQPIALAAECFIASALTADDIVDGARTRWRKQTAYARWGDAETWLIAEVLHSLAHTAIEGMDPAVAAPVRSSFRRFFEGQFREIVPKQEQTTRETITLAMERTGALLQACVVAPALLAQSTYMDSLVAFGEHFGTAFQLADDVWDFVGDPRIMGKPILGDLLNGQPNVVLAHALSKKGNRDKQTVLRLYGKGTLGNPGDRSRVVGALTRLGSLQHATSIVKQHLRRAETALQKIPSGRPRRVFEAFLNLIGELPVPHDRG